MKLICSVHVYDDEHLRALQTRYCLPDFGWIPTYLRYQYQALLWQKIFLGKHPENQNLLESHRSVP